MGSCLGCHLNPEVGSAAKGGFGTRLAAGRLRLVVKRREGFLHLSQQLLLRQFLHGICLVMQHTHWWALIMAASPVAVASWYPFSHFQDIYLGQPQAIFGGYLMPMAYHNESGGVNMYRAANAI